MEEETNRHERRRLNKGEEMREHEGRREEEEEGSRAGQGARGNIVSGREEHKLGAAADN